MYNGYICHVKVISTAHYESVWVWGGGQFTHVNIKQPHQQIEVTKSLIYYSTA